MIMTVALNTEYDLYIRINRRQLLNLKIGRDKKLQFIDSVICLGMRQKIADAPVVIRASLVDFHPLTLL